MNRRHCLLFVLFFLVAPVPLVGQEKKATTWKAGAAKVSITPEEFMWMSGYGARTKPAEGKVHELWAKALVLVDGHGKRSVILSMDLVGIGKELSDNVCAELKKHYGFEREEIMLSVSHTHCGPVVGHNLQAMYNLDARQQQLVTTYTKGLKDALVRLVGTALESQRPVEVSWGTGSASFATNRRNNKEADVPKLREIGQLKGPVDHEVPVLAVRERDGKMYAVVFGYACHATVLSFYQWCGDYPGFAQLELEKRYPGAVALFVAGCGGDQNPLPRRTVELAEGYGKQLAMAVEGVLNSPMTHLQPWLKTSLTHVNLPFGDLPTREILVQDSLGNDRYIAGRAKLLLREIEKTGSLKQTYPYPVQAWQLGNDLTWIALGGEVVVDYSLRLKKELGKVWVTGYANDVMAYIPSLRVLKEGGYEGATAMIYYGQPCAWSPQVEEIILRTAHAQVDKVRQGVAAK